MFVIPLYYRLVDKHAANIISAWILNMDITLDERNVFLSYRIIKHLITNQFYDVA